MIEPTTIKTDRYQIHLGSIIYFRDGDRTFRIKPELYSDFTNGLKHVMRAGGDINKFIGFFIPYAEEV